VSFLAITQNVIPPGISCFNPSDREICLQFGGNILDTYTRLHFSIPAFLKASSKDARRSLWTPTPLVKKIFVGTIIIFIVFFLSLSFGGF
jgi:hypothetical protein